MWGRVLVALFFVVLSLSDATARSHHPNQNRHQTQGAQQQPAADQRGTDQSPVVVKIAPTPKSEADAAAEAKDRQEKAKLDTALVKFNGDLAFYTLILAIVAALQFIALFVQAILLRGTLKATTAAANIAKDALISTERAFVFLEDFDPVWTIGLRGSGDNNREFRHFAIRLRWRNNGTTPTRNMTVIVNWHPTQGNLPDGFPYSYGEGVEPSPMFLGPQATEWSEAIDIPANVATAALKGTENLFIWGRVEYRDIFDDTPLHFTEWCYKMVFTRVTPEPLTQFVAFGPHNRSDEDTRQKRERA
jgi:hypothetical protein